MSSRDERLESHQGETWFYFFFVVVVFLGFFGEISLKNFSCVGCTTVEEADIIKLRIESLHAFIT